MNSPLIELYRQIGGPLSSNESRRILDEQICEIYKTPEAAQQIIQILGTEGVEPFVRRQASIGLRSIIRNQLRLLIENLQSSPDQSFLNALLMILLNEADKIVAESIINSLLPIFEVVHDNWTNLLQLITTLLTATDNSHISIGLNLISDFLPYSSEKFISESLQAISGFLQSALSSTDPNILIDGMKLFSALLYTGIPVEAFSEQFSAILQRILEIFHQFLIQPDDYNNKSAQASNHLSIILKHEPLFVPPTEIYSALLQISSDGSIDKELHHYPLYPIKVLIKRYGDTLQSIFPQSVQLFLGIAAIQFSDVGCDDLIGPTTISSLFSYMTSSAANPDEFIQMVLQQLSQDGNVPLSYASICALLGLVESDADEIEKYVETMVQYLLQKIQLSSITLIEVCLKLFKKLIESQSESVFPFADVICTISLQLYTSQANENLIKASLDVISSVFSDLSLDSSFVMKYLPQIIGQYQNSPQTLKGDFMRCIANCVSSCEYDSQAFVESILPMVMEGAQLESEEDVDIKICSIEALGTMLSFAGEKCAGIYEAAIQIILSAATSEKFGLRSIGIKALINIIRISEGELPLDFTQFAVKAAIVAMNTKIPDSDATIEDDSSCSAEEIIHDGFTLLRLLMKYHPDCCVAFIDKIPGLLSQAFKNKYQSIQLSAITLSAYFVITFNPSETDIYDYLYQFITTSADKDLVLASFKSYRKMLSRSTNQYAAINFERFTMASFQCMAYQLPFQNGSFKYQKGVYTTLEMYYYVAIIEQSSAFPNEKFIETCLAVMEHLSILDAFTLLEILSSYIEEGGAVPQPIIQFGLQKLELCDFSHGNEPILFIRSLIQTNPQAMASSIQAILNLLIPKLAADQLHTKNYWPTIMSIISTIFTLLQSPLNSNGTMDLNQYLPLILPKLPVKQYVNDAEFICGSIINLIRTHLAQITQYIPEIIRIFVQTLALSKGQFEQLRLSPETIESMAESIRHVLRTNAELEGQIPVWLENDPVKLQYFKARLQSE